MLGDPGTGKSLIGRALAAHLTELYEKHRIPLQDVICWKNDLIPSEPKISSSPAGEGKKVIFKEKLKATKKIFLQKIGIKALTYLMTIVASIFMFAGFYFLWQQKLQWDANAATAFGTLVQEQYGGDFTRYILDSFVSIGTTTFLPAGMMLMFLILVIVLGHESVWCEPWDEAP